MTHISSTTAMHRPAISGHASSIRGERDGIALAARMEPQTSSGSQPTTDSVRDPVSGSQKTEGVARNEHHRASPSRIEGPTPQELAHLRELKVRDREVRAHERAHAAAAAGVAHSAPRYTFTRGPDGRQYAIGGEVSIDTSPVAGDPEATLKKARIIQRAALAPAEPSAQDRAVAARARAMAQNAQAEIQQSRAEAPAAPDDSDGVIGLDSAGEQAAAQPVSGEASERIKSGALCAVCGDNHSATLHLDATYLNAENGKAPEPRGHLVDYHA